MRTEQTLFDMPAPSHEEIARAVERAHQLRARAMRDWLTAVSSGVARLARRVSPAADGARTPHHAPRGCSARERDARAVNAPEAA